MSDKTTEEAAPKSPLDLLNEISDRYGFPSWFALCNYPDFDGMNMVPQEACLEYSDSFSTTTAQLREENERLRNALQEIEQYSDGGSFLNAMINMKRIATEALTPKPPKTNG